VHLLDKQFAPLKITIGFSEGNFAFAHRFDFCSAEHEARSIGIQELKFMACLLISDVYDFIELILFDYRHEMGDLRFESKRFGFYPLIRGFNGVIVIVVLIVVCLALSNSHCYLLLVILLKL
jgi:hypothetical protein